MKDLEIRILLVDDDPDILEFVGYNLKKEGYLISKASDGKEALAKAKTEKPDLVLLDIMMPELDGMETCERLRALPHMKNLFIIFLTARSEDYSQLAAYEAGADDYIIKPIKPKILVSKIKSLLKRIHQPTTPAILQVGNIQIYVEEYRVVKGKEEIRLPRKEFALLLLLASEPNKVFTRKRILSEVWGSDIVVGDRTIDVHIRKLRAKLGDNLVKTVKGVGYKMVF